MHRLDWGSLLDAHKRGLQVQVILDKRQRREQYSSANFTKAAQEKNAENLLIIQDKALAAQCAQNWQAHAQHA